MRALAWAALAGFLAAGCADPGEDDVRTVRLELDNQSDVGVSGWLRGRDASNAILAQFQGRVEGGSVDGSDRLLVMDGLDHFDAILSLAGAAEESVQLAYDADRCRESDPVVFRIVARQDALRVRYEPQLLCPA